MVRLTLILLLAFFSLFGCDKKPGKTDIGFIGTLSGRYSDLGQATLQGVVLALEQTGADSYVNLIVKDDFGKPSEAEDIIRLFGKQGVKYVIGPNISSVAAAVVPMLEMYGIKMLSPTVSTSDLAGKKDDFLRIMPHNNYHQTEVISKYLTEELNMKDVVVIYDSRNAAYSSDIVKKFTEAYMRIGGMVRDVRSYNPDSGESLSGLLDKDKDNPPSLYYVIGSAMDTSLIIWQIKKNGFDSGILIRKWAASNEFYRLGGDAVEGVMLFDFYLNKHTAEYGKFEKEYKSRFQREPAWMSVYGFEAARILLDSLDDLKDGRNFIDAVSDSAKNNKLLTGFKFDEYGDAYLPLHFFVISEGETIYKGPAE